MRQYTIKADEDVVCLVLGRDTLNRIIGQKDKKSAHLTTLRKPE